MVEFTDPALASNYNQALNKVNDLAKQIAQKQSEMVTYKEQMAAAEQEQMKKNQADAAQAQNNSQNNNVVATQTQQSTTNAAPVQESLEIAKKRIQLSSQYLDLGQRKKEKKKVLDNLHEEFNDWQENIDIKILEALDSDDSLENIAKLSSDIEAKINKEFYDSYIKKLRVVEMELRTLNGELFNIKGQLSKLDEEESNLSKPETQKIYESFQLNEDDDEIMDIDDAEIGEDDDFVFYIEVINNDVVVAKVFKTDEDSPWEVKDIIGDAEWLDDIEFKDYFDKLEIINYLAEIFGDVKEISEDDYNSYLDDKTKSDKEFYEKK